MMTSMSRRRRRDVFYVVSSVVVLTVLYQAALGWAPKTDKHLSNMAAANSNIRHVTDGMARHVIDGLDEYVTDGTGHSDATEPSVRPRIVRPEASTSAADDVNFRCPSTRFLNRTFPICVYSRAKDRLVSGGFIDAGYVDEAMARRVVAFLEEFDAVDDRRRDDDDGGSISNGSTSSNPTELVDIGANLGSFTLAVAHDAVGVRRVVAVEPNRDTMRRLARSVYLGGVADRVTLVENAVADRRRRRVEIGCDPTNRANTYLLAVGRRYRQVVGPGGGLQRRQRQPVRRRRATACTGETVETIVLDDLVPLLRSRRAVIKVDVQGGEVDIFRPSAAGEFFRQIDVPVLIVEWVLHASESDTADKRRSVDAFLDFFYRRNYSVFDSNGATLGADWTKWSYDIILKKQYST